MNRHDRQFALATAQHEFASPPDLDDRDPSDALDTIATRMAANFDVGELLGDLYDDGYAYGALDRLMGGRPPCFGDESSLQKLRRVLLKLEQDVEREMAA